MISIDHILYYYIPTFVTLPICYDKHDLLCEFPSLLVLLKYPLTYAYNMHLYSIKKMQSYSELFIDVVCSLDDYALEHSSYIYSNRSSTEIQQLRISAVLFRRSLPSEVMTCHTRCHMRQRGSPIFDRSLHRFLMGTVKLSVVFPSSLV